MGKKRECAMRYCFYVIQTIMSEKNTLQWWMLDNDQNRLEMSSENPLSSRAFQIGLTILHYYWGQVHLGSQQWFDGTTSCFLFIVSLPNRCPSCDENQIFIQHILPGSSKCAMRVDDCIGPGNWIISVNTCKPLENIKSWYPVLSVFLTCVCYLLPRI